MSELESQDKPIITLSVKITPYHMENLYIFKNDQPQEVVSNFISTHKLNRKIEPLLVEEIYKQLGQIVEEELQKIESAHIGEIKSGKQSKVYGNIGDRLYQQGKLKQERSELQKMAKKSKIYFEELKNNTFSPHISPSPSLASSESSMIIPKRKAQGRVKFPEEILECTFQPSSNSQPNEKIFDELYYDAFLKKERMKIRHEIFYGKNEPKKKVGKTKDVYERLVSKKHQSLQKIEKQREKMNEPFDETGRVLYEPMTGRPPNHNRNSPSDSVYEELYKKTPKKVSREYPEPAAIKPRPRSEKLLMNVKIKNFFEIFSLLEPNENGLLYGARMNIYNLNEEILKLLCPLLEEIELVEDPLNFEDFVEAMNALMETLTPGEKSVLYTRKKAEENLDEERVKYRIVGQDIYSRGLEFINHSKRKIRNEKEKEYENELKGCTFHPVIVNYRR